MKMVLSRRRSRGGAGREGSVAIEFAILGPVLVLMLMGMALYGGWFWLAQSVQSLATESARSAVAGLDDDERRALAQEFAAAETIRAYGLDVERLDIAVETGSEAIRVRVSYDVADHPIMALSALIPAPPTVIERSAVVRTGGF